MESCLVGSITLSVVPSKTRNGSGVDAWARISIPCQVVTASVWIGTGEGSDDAATCALGDDVDDAAALAPPTAARHPATASPGSTRDAKLRGVTLRPITWSAYHRHCRVSPPRAPLTPASSATERACDDVAVQGSLG